MQVEMIPTSVFPRQGLLLKILRFYCSCKIYVNVKTLGLNCTVDLYVFNVWGEMNIKLESSHYGAQLILVSQIVV